MIEKINVKELDKLEKLFPNTFFKDKVLYDMNNNTFTRYYLYKIDNKIIACINYQIMYIYI